MSVDISVVIPVFNEEENVELLYNQLKEVLDRKDYSYEIIWVDDGSSDKTYAVIKGIATKDSTVLGIRLRRNFGQTAALSAGFDHARGKVIIPMDGDLQNDPADIPRLIEQIENGYDVVSGWRKRRYESFLTRRVPSMLANSLISIVTGVKLHDYGCTLKAYKCEIIKDIRFYGEMHRFIPAYAAWIGANVTELVVSHRRREFGKSKYGLFRVGKVILDLLTVKFFGSFSTKPIHLFGGIGFGLFFLGIISGMTIVIRKILFGDYIIQSPLLLLTVMLFILSVQFILIGLLAEIIIRTYHESQNKLIYVIKDLTPNS